MLRISEIPRCRSLEFPRGRSGAGAWDELTGLSSAGLLSGEFGDGDGLVAGGAAAAGSGPAHECSALVAALVPECAAAAAAALVNRARPPGPGFGDDDGCPGRVAAPPAGERRQAPEQNLRRPAGVNGCWQTGQGVVTPS